MMEYDVVDRRKSLFSSKELHVSSCSNSSYWTSGKNNVELIELSIPIYSDIQKIPLCSGSLDTHYSCDFPIYTRPSLSYLSGNPLICDCSFVWFLRESSANRKRIVDYNAMKCGNSKMKSYLVKKITRENLICKTKQYKLKDYCSKIYIFWNCKKTLPRIPFDVFSGGGKIGDLRGQFPCDCDTVWFIRRLRTHAAKMRFMELHWMLLCKADKTKGISKPLRMPAITEAKICPQKGNDLCKVNPCPAKVTKCKNIANTYKCIDVNECLASPCKSHEVCVNKIKTGYECQCPKKFMRDKATKKCICSNSENLCPKHERCVPVILKSKMSYRCVDADECLTGDYKCRDGEECRNKVNGYECRCLPGLNRDGSKCVAGFDPCEAKPPVCDFKTQRCVSANWKSYECLDLDECSTQKHDCDKHAKCMNTQPGFKCQCKPGFKEYDKGRTCKDLNECSNKFLCSKHAKCTNLPGSYKCECNPGYFGDGKYCNDKDKCKGHKKCSAHAICKNKIGGTFQCICKKGYNGNGKVCKEINECSQNKDICPADSKCHNTPGSYTCKCRHGFKLKNGRCLDVDECKVNSHNCHKNALCINSVGSYRCRCKEGFEHLKNGRLCLKDGETSKSSNTLIIIVAVLAPLLVIILISSWLYWQRRNRQRKKNDSEESKTLLENQIAQDTQ